ncbi:MAG: ABC transporter ATP-binding protein [Clostridiales bacterium]|nr:ABC transporter ATP-binding protein [Clostridiales bacterium]
MPNRMPPGRRPRGPRGPIMMGGEKPKNFRGSIKKLIGYVSPFKWHLLLVAFCSAATTVFTAVGPKILSLITNELSRGVMEMATGGSKGIDFEYIGSIIITLLGLYIVSMVFSYLQGFIIAEISTKIGYNLRNTMMEKINRLPVKYFNTMTHGEVLSRITNDVDTMTQGMTNSITQSIRTIATLVFVLIMMISISWKLTLVAMCMIPVSAIFTMLTVKLSQKHYRNQQKYLGAVNGHVEEMYGGHTVIKAFSGEERALREFDELNDKLYNSAWRAQFLTGLMMPIMNIIEHIGYVVICILGAYMTAAKALMVGDIQAFLQYIRSFTQPIRQIANISSQMQSMAAAAERVFEFLDEEEETDGEVRYEMSKMEIKGDVSFDHVKFSYNKDEPVIKDFSASVKAGQKIAIVGPTGAGKTTMVKLLMRFHDLDDGAIYIDGYNIAEFARKDLRSVLSMVLQDTWLFNGTIMENIRYGNLNASDEEVVKAAKAAQVDHFVRTLPGSYQMVINEESSNISQGQKQLLTIARAILADKKILILDEATSSVDTRTEILIQRAMDNLMKGRTSFIIAHRLSTIRNADLILCMRDGDIVEQGTHDELMAENGFYAQLYNSQFERVSQPAD